MDILLTNNPLVKELCQGEFELYFTDTDIHEILTQVRDFIHKGHRLLTHPLSGSVKPNETLYKSVLITDKMDEIDFKSVGIIEDCIQTVQKFPQKQIPDEYRNDMQIVDLSLIRSALEK